MMCIFFYEFCVYTSEHVSRHTWSSFSFFLEILLRILKFYAYFLHKTQSISTLHAAGVNVWMITGDKAETGLAIGEWGFLYAY